MVIPQAFAQEDISEPPLSQNACDDGKEIPLSHNISVGTVDRWCISNQGWIWLEISDISKATVLTIDVPYDVLPVVTNDNLFDYNIFVSTISHPLLIKELVIAQYCDYQTLEFNLSPESLSTRINIDYPYSPEGPKVDHEHNLTVSVLDLEHCIKNTMPSRDDAMEDDTMEDDTIMGDAMSSKDDVMDDGTVMGDKIFDDAMEDEMMGDTMDDTMTDDTMEDEMMGDTMDDTMTDDTMDDTMMKDDGVLKTASLDDVISGTAMDVLGTKDSWDFCGADALPLNYTLSSGTLLEFCSVRLVSSFEFSADMEWVEDNTLFTVDIPYGILPLVTSENKGDFAIFINEHYVIGGLVDDLLTHQYLDYQTFEFNLENDTQQVKLLFAIHSGTDGLDHELNMQNALLGIESNDGQSSMTFMEEELESMRDETMDDAMMDDMKKPEVTSSDIEWAKGTPQEELLRLMGEPTHNSMMGLISITQGTFIQIEQRGCESDMVMLANSAKNKSLCVDPASVNGLIDLGYGYIDVFIKECDSTQVPLVNSERTKTICVLPESLVTLIERGFEPIGEFIEPE